MKKLSLWKKILERNQFAFSKNALCLMTVGINSLILKSNRNPQPFLVQICVIIMHLHREISMSTIFSKNNNT